MPSKSASTSSSSASSSASSGVAGGGFQPAAHVPFPELAAHAASVLANVELVTVTFSGYAKVATVESFGDLVGTSSWLSAVGAEYGVGKGTHLAKVALPDAAPASIDDSGIQTLLYERIEDGTLPTSTQPNHDVLYMLYVPPETTLTATDGGVFCSDYVGYHDQTTIGGQHIAYAVIGDCMFADADITSTAAHEYIEAATDPSSDGFFLDPKSQYDPWLGLWGSEVADLCEELGEVTEGAIALQRSWSNAAAKMAVSSPCVPTPPGELFFDVTASPSSMPVVAPGGSATFTLTGWSAAEVPDWALAVAAAPSTDFQPGAQLAAKHLNNGVSTTLVLTLPPGTPSGSIGSVLIYSGDGLGRVWPVGVIAK